MTSPVTVPTQPLHLLSSQPLCPCAGRKVGAVGILALQGSGSQRQVSGAQPVTCPCQTALSYLHLHPLLLVAAVAAPCGGEVCRPVSHSPSLLVSATLTAGGESGKWACRSPPRGAAIAATNGGTGTNVSIGPRGTGDPRYATASAIKLELTKQ